MVDFYFKNCIFQRLCDKLYGIHKVHANYARVFHEWSLIEKDIAQPLQSAGHYMDV